MTIETSTAPRIIEFQRCLNCRDIGGYAGRDGRRVRWRRLFCSMTPQYMTGCPSCSHIEACWPEVSLLLSLVHPRLRM